MNMRINNVATGNERFPRARKACAMPSPAIIDSSYMMIRSRHFVSLVIDDALYHHRIGRPYAMRRITSTRDGAVIELRVNAGFSGRFVLHAKSTAAQ